MSDNQRKKAAPADDDRNLVLVDDDFNEADLDDKIWLYWERNRKYIVGGAVAIFVIGLGFIAAKSLKAYRIEAVGAEYAAALTPESKLNFAATHRGSPLSALAALESADALYAKKDYAAAGKAYALAAELASVATGGAPVVAARAPAVAAALCEIRAGRPEAGIAALTRLADDTTAAKSVRLHARYALAEHACGEKDFAKANKILLRFDEEAKKEPVAREWLRSDSPRGLLNQLFPELLAAKQAAPAK